MSIFFNSLKREVGKNSGKWISNVIFKDRHSTPIKIIKHNTETNPLLQKELIAKIKFEEKKLEIDKKKANFEHSNLLNEKRNLILEKELSENKTDLFNFGLNILTEIKSSDWSSKKTGQMIDQNQYLDTYLFKLKQIQTKLCFLNAASEADFLRKEIKKIEMRKAFQKFSFILIFAIFLLLLSIFK